MKKVERWREKKVRDSKVGVEKCITKKRDDFITIERSKMAKWLYYYGTEGVILLYRKNNECHTKFVISYKMSFIFP